jgi:hypothetical protein
MITETSYIGYLELRKAWNCTSCILAVACLSGTYVRMLSVDLPIAQRML